MNEQQPLAGLKALREHMMRQKVSLEQVRDAYSTLEMPDPVALLEPTPLAGAKLQGSIYSLATLAQVAAENDIEVMDTALTTLDRVIALVEDGREAEAKALFGALGDLRGQFWKWPSR